MGPDARMAGDGPVRFRFPRGMRLSESRDFAEVRANGRAFHGRLFILSFLARPGETGNRFGIITSRRVGNAVARSRSRRLLREVVRAAAPSLKPGHWIVLIARNGMAEAELETVRREWLRLAERASILTPEPGVPPADHSR